MYFHSVANISLLEKNTIVYVHNLESNSRHDVLCQTGLKSLKDAEDDNSKKVLYIFHYATIISPSYRTSSLI